MGKQMNKQNSKRWFNFKNEGDVPVLSIFDEIGGWGTWADEFIDQLDAVNAPEIKVRLFSPGGYVDEGIQIYNALRRHDARIVIEIDAMAASIASVIAMAGDEIVMAEEAMMMIHDPWSGVMGGADDMRKTADVLDKLKSSIIKAYRKQTGLSEAEISDLMKEETWMTADEAVAFGFADRVDTLSKEEQPQNSSVKNRFTTKIIAGLKQVPERIADLWDMPEQAALMLSPQAMANIATDSAAADKKAGAMPETPKKQEVIMTDKKKAAPNDAADQVKNAIGRERERVSEISARAEQAATMIGKDKAESLAREAIAKGVDEAAFSNQLFDAMEAKAAEQQTFLSSPIGLSSEEAGGFMFKNLISALASGKRDLAGLEMEVCAEMESRAKDIGIQSQGTLVPVDVLARPQNVLTTAGAAPSVQTDVLAQSFIELLRNNLVVKSLGARVISGLQGNASFPRQIGGATSSWVTEGQQAAESVFSLNNLSLTPKSVTARHLVSKQTMLQSSLDVEAMLREDLAQGQAEAIDFAAVFGSGVGAEPLGILNTTGIALITMGVDGAPFTNLDPLLDLVTKVKTSKAAKGKMAFLTNALVEGAIYKLKETTNGYLIQSKDTETPADGSTLSVRGYNVVTSEQVPSNFAKGVGTGLSASIFGNWNDLIIGEWGALDILVNPYSKGIGNLEVEVLQFCDMGLRHPASFAAIKDIVA